MASHLDKYPYREDQSGNHSSGNVSKIRAMIIAKEARADPTTVNGLVKMSLTKREVREGIIAYLNSL